MNHVVNVLHIDQPKTLCYGGTGAILRRMMDELRGYREAHPAVAAMLLGALLMTGELQTHHWLKTRDLQFPSHRHTVKELWVRTCRSFAVVLSFPLISC
jgi:hypothetical protein